MRNYRKTNRIGETHLASNGQIMTIITYRNAQDVDIQFEDGTIVRHKKYLHFEQGKIRNSNSNFRYNLKSRIGETAISNLGLKMKIINYRSTTDIDVQFEDKTIVRNKTYGNFRRGCILHPHYIHPAHTIKDRTGETKRAHNGMQMTLIAYRLDNDIDIRFEDGLIVKHQYYQMFRKGYIKHPFPYEIGHISIDKPAYIYKDTGFFFCHCIKTNRVGIMSVDEIKACPCQTLQIEKRTKETQAIEE